MFLHIKDTSIKGSTLPSNTDNLLGCFQKVILLIFFRIKNFSCGSEIQQAHSDTVLGRFLGQNHV